MKKFIITMCILAVTTGIANAGPVRGHHQVPHNCHPKAHRMVHKAPPVVPVFYQIPIQSQSYSTGYPSITFSNRFFDITLGL